VKVLIAAPIPPPYNGTEVMTALLLKSPFSTAVELIHIDTSLRKRIESRGRVSPGDVMRTLMITAKILGTCLWHRPHIVYMLLSQNTSGFLRDSVYVLVAKITGRFAVVRFGGAQFDTFYKMSSRGFQWYVRRILHQLDCVIVRSEHFKAQFLRHVPPERFSVVPVAIDVPEYRRIGRAVSTPPMILFVGMISRAKGAVDLLKAVPLVQGEFAECEFVFAGARIYKERNLRGLSGDPFDVELQEQLAKLELTGTVHFPGVVTGDAKEDLLRRATLFVCPSYSEGGGPLAAIEAMAAGIPVVATRVGLMPDYFRQGREILFFDIGDVEAMADNICRLLRHPAEAVRMGFCGQEVVTQNLNLEVYAAKLEALFTRLMQGNHRLR
jgi:glycosyltransferase involved in cell wall biosynthesis